MEFIDTHCHLQFDKLADNLDQVLKDSISAGVTKFICVGTTVADSQKAVGLAESHDSVWAAVGVHPHDAKGFDFQDQALQMENLLKRPKVVAVGEIGLDFYKNYSPRADQEKLLRHQIEIGISTGLPFIFHIREAWDDFWRIFDSYQSVSRQIRGVVHSFSADPVRLDEVLRRGLLVGLNGIMTFTADQAQLVAAKQAPSSRLMLETDAPFLAPKPFRGKICEPKHVRTIAEFLADLRGEDIEDLASHTSANAIELFGLV